MPYKYIVRIEDEFSLLTYTFDDSVEAFEFYESKVDEQLVNDTRLQISIYRMMKFDKSIL